MAVTTRMGLRLPDAGDNFNRINDVIDNWNTIDDATRYDENETVTGNWKMTGTEQHGADANNMTTAVDGFVTLIGTARAMMDMSFNIVRLKKGGVSDPAESIVGITYALGFDATADEEVFLTTVIPHDYDNGTDLKAHFHWAPSDGNAGDVTWGIEYQIMRPENNHVLTTATTTLIVVDATQSLQDECLQSGDITIDGTGVEKGDMLHARIFRDANASEGGASDTYAVDANLCTFDIEYMVDGHGEDVQW